MELFGQPLSTAEIIGTVAGIAGVLLTVKKSVWCFPMGLVNVGLYAFLFFQSKLYADAALQVIYILLLAYGWMQWNRPDVQKGFVVTRVSAKLWTKLAAVCIVSTFILGISFQTYTDASLPYLDSFLASMSLVAQWLVAKKKLENWLLWIAADLLYVGMYIYKDLYLTAALYIVFIGLAAAGYVEWKKKSVSHAAAR
jgi:nicotinamide mononucleotide transporter